MIKCALFDLDGTLVNTAEDLIRATIHTLKKFGVNPKWTHEEYVSFVGNGARKLLDRAFDGKLDEDTLDKALAFFKKDYEKILTDNAFIYPGIKDALDCLKEKGILIAVVTNKPHGAAVLMVETLFGEDYFDVIIGAEENYPKKPDPYTANLALEKLGCKGSEGIFFGDSDVDVYTAKNAGMEGVGCSWGFRSFECLFSASPSVIIDKAEFIPKLF